MPVLTFSRHFPKGHPRAGQPTYFVEKILNSLGIKTASELLPGVHDIINDFLMLDSEYVKHHTIRAGHRWKVGDKFSPRVWSGKPYQSKQITIGPDIEIKQIWDIEITQANIGNVQRVKVKINNVDFCYIGISVMANIIDLANNDGLALTDFVSWFQKIPFTGQIICWNENIKY